MAGFLYLKHLFIKVIIDYIIFLLLSNEFNNFFYYFLSNLLMKIQILFIIY